MRIGIVITGNSIESISPFNSVLIQRSREKLKSGGAIYEKLHRNEY